MELYTMSNLKHKEFQLTWTYLFSYFWLSGELILIVYFIDALGSSDTEWLLPLALLPFARLYHWLNFSPETLIQTGVILGTIPLIYLEKLDVLGSGLLLIMSIYIALFLLLGILRNRATKYVLTEDKVEIHRFGVKSYVRDSKRPIRMLQNSRGRVLNFACILIPVEKNGQNGKSLLERLFSQKNAKDYEGYVRLDGIFKPSSTNNETIS